MISRIFTVIKDKGVSGYKGFDGKFFTADVIAVVRAPEGLVSVFGLDDDTHAVEEFKRCINTEDIFDNVQFSIFTKKDL